MLTAQRKITLIPFRSSTESGPDIRFPRAVAGEGFDRYSRVVWRQGQRWIQKHWHRVSDPGVSMHDARESLLSFAAMDLARRLYPQEERLLGEVLHEAWNDAHREIPDITPAAPSLVSDSSVTPRPAA